ncbi:MAG: DUF2007 domain-containing protein [Bacteroidota bacterium]|nr:DUF2007 domain-containing protein [Bacteroidota bacterium]
MKDQIITLRTYESTVDALLDLDILQANGIECFINNDQLVELYPTFKDINEGLKIVVFEKDYEKALQLLEELRNAPAGENQASDQDNDEVVENHYLNSFSDPDIIDVIANPTDWTKEEQSIANRIIAKRGLVITADDIRKARAKTTVQIRPESRSSNKMFLWFLVIGYLSIINTIIRATKSTIHFIFGLGITQIIDTISFSLFEKYKLMTVLISLLISGAFIGIGYFAKAKKKWAFLAGLILYGLDTSIFIYANDWLSAAFHILVLLAIISGYIHLTPAVRNPSGD